MKITRLDSAILLSKYHKSILDIKRNDISYYENESNLWNIMSNINVNTIKSNYGYFFEISLSKIILRQLRNGNHHRILKFHYNGMQYYHLEFIDIMQIALIEYCKEIKVAR
jgi:hypothetical protein